MVRLVLLFAVVIMEYVMGLPLPPLPMKDGCYLASTEVEVFRLEGEPIILSFPMFETDLHERNISPPTSEYLISRNNVTDGAAAMATYGSDGRIQQRNKQLWFLPAQVTDSGEYICTYRNESYCVTGTIMLQVYKSSSADMEKLSFPVQVTVGDYLRLSCPSLSNFNRTDRLIEWHKDSGRSASFLQDGGRLIIRDVRRSHAGVYTCQLRALINNQQYKVSRSILLQVEGLYPETTTEPDLSLTSDPGFISTVHTLVIQPPVIVSPLNRTIFESAHGSAVELSCKVLTECQMADSTEVTWLVNDQSVELSHLDERALQGGRRVTRISEGCLIELRLVVERMTEDDERIELKCVTENQGGKQEVVARLQLEDSTSTWLVVAAVALSCFLAVVSSFLYVLFKPKRKKKLDYILAQQNSTF